MVRPRHCGGEEDADDDGHDRRTDLQQEAGC
jgi:hypothetical protein